MTVWIHYNYLCVFVKWFGVVLRHFPASDAPLSL